MKVISILVLIFLSTTSTYSQTFEERIKGKNYFEIVEEVCKEFEDKEYSEHVEGAGKLKHWRRWAYYQGKRVGDNGNIENLQPKITEAWRERKKQIKQTNNKRGLINEWHFYGPTSLSILNTPYPGLGRVTQVAFHPSNPNIIYAGTAGGGLWRSYNDGGSWSCVSDDIPNQSIAGVVIDHANPSTLYVLTGAWNTGQFGETNILSSGLWKSIDAGVNWSQVSIISNSNYLGYDLRQHPTDQTILFAATTRGLYRSEDSGNTWSLVIVGRVTDIEFMPGLPSRVYAALSNSVRFSIDGGVTFPTTAPNNFTSTFDINMAGTNRIELSVTADEPGHVYALAGPTNTTNGGNKFRGLFKSLTAGLTFNTALDTPNVLGRNIFGLDNRHQSNYDLCIATSPTNRNLTVTGGLAIWRTLDGGASIAASSRFNRNDLFAPDYVHPDIHDLEYNPINGNVYAGCDGGIYKSNDHGASWIDITNNLAATQVYYISDFNIDQDRVVIGTQDNGMLYSDGGAFFSYATGDGFDSAVDADDQFVYATINDLVRRTDFNSFTTSNITTGGFGNPLNFNKKIETHPTRPEEIIVGLVDSIHYSQDRGDTYVNLGQRAGDDIVMGPSNNSRIYAGQLNVLIRSDDLGMTWNNIPIGSLSATNFRKVNEIAVNPSNSNHVCVALSGAFSSNRLYFSYNAGDDWDAIAYNLPDLPILCVQVTSDNHIYVGTDIGIYYKRSDWSEWVPLYNGLPTVPVNDIAINETANKIRIGTWGRGVYEMDLQDGTCDFISKVIAYTMEGYNIFVGSNIINHSGIILGNGESEVYMQAGNRIDFRPGSNVETGAFVNAKIGDCTDYPLRSDMQQAEIMKIKNPANKFKYGNLDFLGIKGNTATLRLRIFIEDKYGISITDESGNTQEVFIKDKVFEPGEYDIEIDISKINLDFGYVHLIQDEIHCHFQEFKPKPKTE